MLDIRETLAGGFGAICCAYSGNPFDVVKVRLQTQGASTEVYYKGPIDCLRKIYGKEGIFALWKGVTPALGSAFIENSVLFTANGIIKRLYTSHPDSSEKDLSFFESSFIGGLSGVCSATCITPAEMIKVRTQNSQKQFSPASAIVTVYKEEGVRGLFRGLSSTIMRDVPFTFFFFGGYEVFTHLLWTYGDGVFVSDASGSNNGGSSDYEIDKSLNPLGIYIAGGCAGATGWGLAFPMDTVKSRIQTSNTNTTFREVFRTIYATSGVKGFYGGWSSAVLRAFPANAGLFLGYEMAVKFLKGASSS